MPILRHQVDSIETSFLQWSHSVHSLRGVLSKCGRKEIRELAECEHSPEDDLIVQRVDSEEKRELLGERADGLQSSWVDS